MEAGETIKRMQVRRFSHGAVSSMRRTAWLRLPMGCDGVGCSLMAQLAAADVLLAAACVRAQSARSRCRSCINYIAFAPGQQERDREPYAARGRALST